MYHLFPKELRGRASRTTGIFLSPFITMKAIILAAGKGERPGGRAEAFLNEQEVDELLYFLASNPKAGKMIQGTGGIRKLRWASSGKGKRGGSRVIYFFHSENMSLFLLTIFSKSEKADLTTRERNDLAKLTKLLVKQYEG